MTSEDTHPDPTGPEPAETEKARDGAPSNVRTLRQQIDAEAAAQAGESIEDRAGEEPEEESDGQFTFVVEENGKQVAFRDLIKRGTPIEYRYQLSGKSIANVRGGLIDPYAASHMMVADCVLDSVKDQYIRTGDGTVDKVILYVTLKPRAVQQAFSEAGQVMLAEGAKARAAA